MKILKYILLIFIYVSYLRIVIADTLETNVVYTILTLPQQYEWEMKAKGTLYLSITGTGTKYYLKYNGASSGNLATTSNYDYVGTLNSTTEVILNAEGYFSIYIDGTNCVGLCTGQILVNQAYLFNSWSESLNVGKKSGEDSTYVKLKSLTGSVKFVGDSSLAKFDVGLRRNNLPTSTEYNIQLTNINSFEYTFSFWEILSGSYYLQMRPESCAISCKATIEITESWMYTVVHSVSDWITSNVVASIFIGIGIVAIIVILLLVILCLFFCIWYGFVFCGIKINQRKHKHNSCIDIGEFKITIPEPSKDEQISVEKYMDNTYIKSVQSRMESKYSNEIKSNEAPDHSSKD